MWQCSCSAQIFCQFQMKLDLCIFFIGHYIPQLAIALLDHNEHSKDFKFKIKGVVVRTYYSMLDFHFYNFGNMLICFS